MHQTVVNSETFPLVGLLLLMFMPMLLLCTLHASPSSASYTYYLEPSAWFLDPTRGWGQARNLRIQAWARHEWTGLVTRHEPTGRVTRQQQLRSQARQLREVKPKAAI